jgi:hypothetical protein
MVRSSEASVAQRARVGALLLIAFIVILPQRAAAGGTEFPADGTRNLGRGGAGMARADDPYVMVRNPARLADLWDDQAMLGAHFLMADSCFQPIGGYRIGSTGTASAIQVGDETLVLNTPAGATDLDGEPLNAFQSEPYPEVCFEGPMPFLPHVALTMKPAHNIGVGLGFFPPDNAALNQWGNRDGTVDTENGLRPNPLRYYRSHLNTSYFSMLAAIGYRPAQFIRIGFGFQWQLAVYQARTWTTSVTGLNPINDVRTDVFGRDLFIPGFVHSVHIKPIDALDIALSFKWSDLVKSKAKLDLTSGAFGTGERFQYLGMDSDTPTGGTTAIPTTSHNQPGDVRSGPVWVPQLSFGVRYAQRLKPLIHHREWAKAKAASSTTEDSMQNERWDIELDFVYYLTSMYDYTEFTNDSATISLQTIDQSGTPSNITTAVGDCIEPLVIKPGELCRKRQVRTQINGKNQFTARIGGDYNVLPGRFTVRAGASYEEDGQDVEWLNVQQYMYGRMGLHTGFTVRIAEKTDFTFGFAHFVQKEIRLQVGGARLADFIQLYQQAEAPRGVGAETYHLETGSGFAVDPKGPEAMKKGPFDGIAGVEVPNAGQMEPGPYFINAGSYYYNLSVLSFEVTQRF